MKDSAVHAALGIVNLNTCSGQSQLCQTGGSSPEMQMGNSYGKNQNFSEAFKSCVLFAQ